MHSEGRDLGSLGIPQSEERCGSPPRKAEPGGEIQVQWPKEHSSPALLQTNVVTVPQFPSGATGTTAGPHLTGRKGGKGK